MLRQSILFLSFLFFVFLFQAKANVFYQEDLKTHLRWNIKVPKEDIFVVKRDKRVFIETQDLNIFNDIQKRLKQSKINEKYFSDLKVSNDNFPKQPASISLALSDSSVELFSFYRENEGKYIVDFWINNDKVSTVKKLKKVSLTPLPKNPLISGDKGKILPIIKIKEKNNLKKPRRSQSHRDFRYGASFIWDYPPLIPEVVSEINIKSKLPESLFPIKDRENLEDPKEAHVQLSINFYREEKWGLMNKSLTLYEKKYGNDSNTLINEYLKVNALLRQNLLNPSKSIQMTAVTMLENLKDMSKDYTFKSAVMKYLIQYFKNKKDYLKTLELSKELYIEAVADFDYEMAQKASLHILSSLSFLRQVDKVDQFIKENKKINKFVSKQMLFSFESYSMLLKGKTKDLIKKYEKLKKTFSKPYHPAILYNVGEAYFRESMLGKSQKAFDDFLVDYSHLRVAPFARLRIALIYDLTDKPAHEILVLYKNAIDRSPHPKARYEAKLRYVGFRVSRNKKVSQTDLETLVFLEQSPDESKILDQNLKKLLWLVRLRSLIVQKKYKNALSYVSTIPYDLLKLNERKVFEGDAAEIIFGIIQEAYFNEDYGKVVKFWEIYKDQYENKVAKNIHMNFIACDSYLKLGLYKSYDRALSQFKKVLKKEQRTFPLWIKRMKANNLNELVEELTLKKLIAEKDWDGVDAKLTSYPVSLRNSLTFSYYTGITFLKKKNIREAISQFEKVLLRQDINDYLSPRQNADLLISYVEALYQLNDHQHFKTVVTALLKDIDSSSLAPVLMVSERINYLLIETLVGDKNTDWKRIELMTKGFRKKFQKSPYTPRISYLYGLSLIKNTKIPEGKEVLKILTNSKETPSHIREMSRSELVSLELKNKTF